MISKEEFSKLRILLVDDMPSNTLLLKAMLKSEGYQLDAASNGYEALEKVKQWMPNIILLDVMMPDIDGFQVAETIRNNPAYENIAIIFITALNSADEIVKGFESGGNDYITKPINAKEVTVRVRQQALLILSRDEITTQVKELEKNIKWRDRLYSVIAHDLRDPLGMVKMLLTMALNEYGEKESQVYDFLQMANAAADKTFNLLDNLLKWTKAQIGNTEVVPKKFSLESVITQNIHLFESTCANKKNVIEFDTKSEETFIFADYDMINTVIRNLLSNAIKFSHPNSKVDVKIVNNDNFSTLSIRDYGVGISEKHVHLILNDSSDISMQGTNGESGHGLGLLLCKYFVEVNGGRISFNSIVGEGTEFFITIPLFKKQ